MRELGERVRLVHELRKLPRAEELAQSRRYRAHVDKVLRHSGRKILRRRHALARDALHAQQPDAQLILQQLAYRADAAVAEVVYVVYMLVAVAKADEPLYYRDYVRYREQALGLRYVELQAAVDLIAADAPKVVSARVEENAFEIFVRVLHARRFVRLQLAEYLKARRLGGIGLVAFYRRGYRRVYVPHTDLRAPLIPELFHMLLREARVPAYAYSVRAVVSCDVLGYQHAGHVVVDQIHLLFPAVEEGDDLVGRAHSERPEHHRHGNLFAVVYLYGYDVPRRQVEFYPRAAVRYELREEALLAGDAEVGAVVDARRARQLVHDDALRPVDYKGPPLRHCGEIAEIDFFFLNFAGRFIDQADRRTKRSRPCKVPAACLIQADLNGIDVIFYKFEDELAVEALDRENFVEKLLQPL